MKSDKYFSGFDSKKHTKIKWFEKIALLFVKKRYSIDDISGYTIMFKILNGKLYHLKSWDQPPKNINRMTL